MNGNSKQKVLLVHNFYLIGGGEHTVFQNEKNLLLGNGHQVIEYTRNNKEISESSIKKICLPFSTVFSIKTYREVVKIIKNQNIEVVHCHNTFPLISPSVYYAALHCKVPVVQTIHNFRFLCPCGILYRNGAICEECITQGLHKSLKYGCYRNSKIGTFIVVLMLKVHRILGTYNKISYIFLTNFNRNKFSSLLSSSNTNKYVKPNFVDFPKQVRARKGIDYDKFVFISRLEESKGVNFLISAWKNLEGKKLVIYGDGPLTDYVKDAVAENPSIIYRGFRPHDEIFEDLSCSAAMIFPSILYEGFPMTLVEAFSMGVPVLCSSVGNGADIVADAKGGICYENGNVEDFEEKLIQISKESVNVELGRNAYQAFVDKYSPEKNYEILKNIYDEVSSNARRD